MYAIIIAGYEKSVRRDYHGMDILLTDKECCFSAVLVQEIQQVVGIRRWAIIKGQSDSTHLGTVPDLSTSCIWHRPDLASGDYRGSGTR